MSEHEQSNFRWSKFIGGIFLAVVFNVFLVFLSLFFLWNEMGYVGMLQWVYILPLAYAARKSEGGGLSAGLLAGAAFMLMLNSTCFGFPWEQKDWYHG